ncbi:hypothetical protein J003_05307 [Cryptococcus neoformans]|nr:hypothetical protein J009_05361 [Cryptococcus neoformans var. grubii]OXH46773.1 hypothetical protein J003_05307 [Cryptococcus neoformans var. grubii]OXH48974.1 hypothetical protein J002_05326 [Cryptococcus neoformans var. grubii]OXH65854.1 hypothetical protein J001_05356 [Cryptococcus neoformans var. grubii]OXH66323.1 hypothetical protein J000_05380 [Cryptococcus neoformans var. grubii]
MPPILSEEESALNPYALLGIEAGATTKEAERAFRKKSLKYHPDKNPAPEAAVIFHQLSLSLGIFQNQAKRNYVDSKLESGRKKKQRYAEMDKKRKAMVDALAAREEEAKKQKVEHVKRRQQQADEEAIKDAGRRMLEEAQKRATAAAAAATAQAPKAPGEPKAATPKPIGGGVSDKRIITAEDLTLVLTLPASSTITSSDLQIRLTASYGPIAHLILPPVPLSQQATESKDGKKKKPKSRKAIVEFASGNWGGCYACWMDHEAGRGMEGVKVKFGSGEVPGWVAWAETQQLGRRSSSASGGDQQSNSANGHPPPKMSFTLPTTTSTPASPPSSTSAPNFPAANDGEISMADLLAKHAQKKSAKADGRRPETAGV